MGNGSGEHPPPGNGWFAFPRAWAWSPDLDAYACRVLVALMAHRNEETQRCDPSLPTLRDDTGLARSTIRHALDTLVKGGMVERMPGRGRGRRTRYRIRWSREKGAEAPIKGSGALPEKGAETTPEQEERNEMKEQDARSLALARSAQPALDVDGVPDFDAWWSAYPRKVGKIAARKAWEKAAESVGADLLLSRLRAQGPSLAGREPRFVPHPATWLNQGRWDDEPDPPSVNGHGGNVATRLLARMEWERPPADPRSIE